MKFAVGYFPTDEGIDPMTLARMVEERPFESLFFTDHTHIPASARRPTRPGLSCRASTARIHDPFVALMAAAGATERIMLGTGICLVVERDPIVTAKQAAASTGSRAGAFCSGSAPGGTARRCANHGTEPARRFSVLRERVEAMKEIWANEEASYHGEHVDFDRIWAWPKPLPQPHPPIIVGGHGKKVLDRVLAFGDEWMPNRIGDDAKISARIARLRQAGVDAGRGSIPTTLANATTDADVLSLYEEAGVHRALFWLAQGDESDAERRLDRLAAGVEAYGFEA